MTVWYSLAAAGAVVLVVVLLLRQQSWRDSMTLSILGWLFIAVLVGAATGGVLLWLLGWPSLPRSTAFTTTETLDLLKIALAVVAGFGGVVILSVNHRKQRFTEKDHDLATNQEEREQTKLLNERFAAAAEQLANDRAQVRLAGVYALAGLADDWDAGRQKCVDVLIAYLRLAQSEDRSPGSGEEEVVKTIFRTFRERLTLGSHSWSAVDFDFTGMTLDNVDFRRTRFSGTVVFDDVTFTGDVTSFRDSWFSGTLRCRGTRFDAAATIFQEVWFDGRADFQSCRFAGTTDLRSLFVDGGTVAFHQCTFNDAVLFDDLVVNPGSLSLDQCQLAGRYARFDRAQIGPMFEQSWMSGLLGRSPAYTKIAGVSIRGCLVHNCELSVDDAYVERGRLKLTNLILRDSQLHIRDTATSHPSLWVRGIHLTDSTVDIPVERELWEAHRGGAPPDPLRR